MENEFDDGNMSFLRNNIPCLIIRNNGANRKGHTFGIGTFCPVPVSPPTSVAGVRICVSGVLGLSFCWLRGWPIGVLICLLLVAAVVPLSPLVPFILARTRGAYSTHSNPPIPMGSVRMLFHTSRSPIHIHAASLYAFILPTIHSATTTTSLVSLFPLSYLY